MTRRPSNIASLSIVFSLFFVGQILVILQPQFNNTDPQEFALNLQTESDDVQHPSSQSQTSPPPPLPPPHERQPPDGHFNGFPVFHRDYKEGFHSNSHCIGENFQSDAWKFRSCHFQNLCFDTEDHQFVLFQSPEQKKLDEAMSHSKLDFFWPASSMNTTVSVGGLNPKWGPEHKDMEWYPAIRSTEDLKSQGGYYVLEKKKVLIPWHSLAGFNPGHLVWDDFLPLYTLLSIFDLTGKEMVLIRFDLWRLAMWASCQRQWPKCRPMLKKFLPLLGTQLDMATTQNDTKLEIIAKRSSSSSSKYVCAPNGAAGLGMLTDHGSKLHGWEEKDYEYAHNIGRGGTLYQFRNWMEHNIIGAKQKNENTQQVSKRKIHKPPYRIIISNASSSRPTRVVSFHKHAELLKRRLGSKYDLDIQEVKLSMMSMAEQVELVSGASIFVTMCGGGAVTAMFLPKGASIFAYFNEGIEKGPRGNKLGNTAARLDWDLLNHIGYLRVHWLPRPKVHAMANGEPEDLQSKVDLDAFVSLVDHELDLISHSDD